jgi:Predicted protease
LILNETRVFTHRYALLDNSRSPQAHQTWFTKRTHQEFSQSQQFKTTFAKWEISRYTPQVLQNAYDFSRAYNLVGGISNAGSGETIVIIDAFGSPTIKQDVEVFDQAFGLPPIHLNIYCPQGCPAFNPISLNEVGWSFDTTLDVEYSHAMAPGATIELVVASTNFGNAINNAMRFALNNHG